MPTHLVLLRGVNVGGHKKLPMADLRAFVASLGFTGAQTLLQSGNLVFRSDGQHSDRTLETLLETAASEQLGLTTTFLLRTVAEWSEVIARNPFADVAQAAPNRLLVVFFRHPPTAESLDLLRTVATASERLHPDSHQLYAALPDGIGDSKLATLLMSQRFSKHATARNWNMILKLGTLAEQR